MIRAGLFFLFLCSAAFAQTSAGTLTGSVLDSSGAVIAGAQVRVIGAETGDLARTLVTNDIGHFVAPLLRPSTYTVEVTHPGFKKLTRQGVTLSIDEVVDLRLTLEPSPHRPDPKGNTHEPHP